MSATYPDYLVTGKAVASLPRKECSQGESAQRLNSLQVNSGCLEKPCESLIQACPIVRCHVQPRKIEHQDTMPICLATCLLDDLSTCLHNLIDLPNLLPAYTTENLINRSPLYSFTCEPTAFPVRQQQRSRPPAPAASGTGLALGLGRGNTVACKPWSFSCSLCAVNLVGTGALRFGGNRRTSFWREQAHFVLAGTRALHFFGKSHTSCWREHAHFPLAGIRAIPLVGKRRPLLWREARTSACVVARGG
eukprot:704915-Pleurochrysis_carterae.AAC.4